MFITEQKNKPKKSCVALKNNYTLKVLPLAVGWDEELGWDDRQSALAGPER